MILTETSAPAASPVSLGELSSHLRLNFGFADSGVEDALLQLYLDNATRAIEQRLGQALILRAFRLETACWDRDGRFAMPIGPVAALTGVSLISANATVAIDVGDLSLAPGATRQVLSGASGGVLPLIPHGGKAEILFEAGYGLAGSTVPGEIRQAVLILAGHLYQNREGDNDATFPAMVSSLIASHHVLRV
ncbi:MAG: hypothetical protein AAF503_02600 [Pseudomonadota bacterium]